MTHPSFLEQWQMDYESATGAEGKVIDVFGAIGCLGGLAIWVVVQEQGSKVLYSPYLNSSPFDDCPADGEDCFGEDRDHYCEGHIFELAPDAWIDSMTGATDWGCGDWGNPTRHILNH